jgi:hypothetical protein
MSRVEMAPEAIREVTDYVEKKEYQTMFEALLKDIDETVAARKKAEEGIRVMQQQILATERERETAIRKLRELGVSEEIIAVSFSGAV